MRQRGFGWERGACSSREDKWREFRKKEEEQIVSVQRLEVNMRRVDWRKASGRRKGSSNYLFGDVTRTIFHQISEAVASAGGGHRDRSRPSPSSSSTSSSSSQHVPTRSEHEITTALEAAEEQAACQPMVEAKRVMLSCLATSPLLLQAIPSVRLQALYETTLAKTTEEEIVGITMEFFTSSTYLVERQKAAIVEKILSSNWSGISQALQCTTLSDVEIYRFINYNKFVRFRDMVIAVFSRSRKVQQLDEDRRRALGNAIFNAENEEALHEIALSALASSIIFDEDSKSKVANDIFDRRYDLLLLPDRFDCDEGGGAVLNSPTVDNVDSNVDSTSLRGELDVAIESEGSPFPSSLDGECLNGQGNNHDEDDSEECPVCLGTNDVVCTTTCNHVFCRECIYGWVESNHSCPICRSSLVAETDISLI